MKDKESNSFTKQIKRYAKVGGVVGTLATKLAGQKYLGVKFWSSIIFHHRSLILLD